jgi:hypothetical protein
MRKKLLGAAVGVLSLTVDVVRHAAWYVRYQVDGSPREEKQPGAPPPR